MVNMHLVDNMLYMMTQLGEVHIDQVRRFFRTDSQYGNEGLSDEITGDGEDDAQMRMVNYYIKRLCWEHFISYDEKTGILSNRRAPVLEPYALSKRLAALWVMVNEGSENIRDFCLMPFPIELLFVTTDNHVFDVTVCLMESEINVIRTVTPKVWRMGLAPNMNDTVNHILLLKDEKWAKEFADVGFDMYCTLSKNNIAEYYEWAK